jgi:Sulfotransferase domain
LSTALPLPNIVVIGAMKCGTTSLHHYLDAHPEISMAAAKELNFFYRKTAWARGVSWYRSHFDPDARLRGEASPNYTKNEKASNLAAERMRQLIPRVRLIYLVRDPIERAVSHYFHTVFKGNEERPLSEALGDLDSPYVQRSLYFRNALAFFASFPSEQLLVVSQEDLRRNRSDTLRSVFRFVGADETFESLEFSRLWQTREEKQASAKRPSQQVEEPELSAEVRERLSEFFQADCDHLRLRTGHSFPLWSV